jgi:hypothetical protein
MDTAPTSTSPPRGLPAPTGFVLRTATVWALTAAGANLVLWGLGDAAGASFVVDPALGDPNLEVDGLKVVLTTLLPLAAGASLLALVAPRSRRWVAAVGMAGAAFAVSSAAGPLAGGHDTATGSLLATMHLTTGTAFVVTVMRVRARMKVTGVAPA